MYLDKIIDQVSEKSELYKAIQYARTNKEQLYTFLEDGRLELTNNLSECSQKPVIIGRKNSMFMGSARGAQSSAVIYSLVEREREWIGTKALPESPVGRTSENGRGW